MQGYKRSHNGECVAQCLRGFYYDSSYKTCLPCDSNCAECTSSTNCIECSPLFLLRSSIGGVCRGQTTAITIFQSPSNELPHLMSTVIGFTEQMQFLKDLQDFALHHSFYKYSEIAQLHRILELLLPLLPNSSQSLDNFSSTFQTVLSRVQVVHFDMKLNLESLFSSSVQQLLSLSLNTPQISYFSLLNTLTSFDRIVTLESYEEAPNTGQHTSSAVNSVENNSTTQVYLTAYALSEPPISSIKIQNHGNEPILTLIRLIVLPDSGLLFQANSGDKVMSHSALSLRSVHPSHIRSQYKFTVMNNPSDFQYSRCMTLNSTLRKLRHLPSCTTTSNDNQFTCTCSGDFSLLLIGISFNALSPEELKLILNQDHSTYAGKEITPLMKIQGILNVLELNSVSHTDRQFFLEHFVLQIKNVDEKQSIFDSLGRIVDILLQKQSVSDNEKYWVVEAITEYSNQYTPSKSQSVILRKLKSFAQTVPDDGVGTSSIQILPLPLNADSQQLGKVKISVPSGLSKSYPQARRIVATRFKSTNLFINTLKSDRFRIFSSPVQLQLLDSQNRQVQVQAQNEPIILEFELESHPSSFQRKCVWWDGQDGVHLSSEGCKSILSNNYQRLRCECNHLTYFLVALDTHELIPASQSLFDLTLHFKGLCVSAGLLLLGFLLAIIAECLDQRDKEQAQMMGDQRRKWTSPLIWFFPCLLYKRDTSQRKKKGKGKQQPEYHSPKHRSSPSRDKKPSLFSFESQQTNEQEARQHLHPYSSKKSSFCGILCYGFLSSNAFISPFYAFDPYASRAGRSSILFIKLLLCLSISLALIHTLEMSTIVVSSAVLGLSLIFTPFSFYGSCFLKKPHKGRAQQYQAENNLQDILPSAQDNRPRDPGFVGAFEDESHQSIRKSRSNLPMQIKCTMLTLLSICLGVVAIVALGFIALLFKTAGQQKLWIVMNISAISIGSLLGFLKTICAAAILAKKKEACCWKCCKLLWVVSHVERVSQNMKREN